MKPPDDEGTEPRLSTGTTDQGWEVVNYSPASGLEAMLPPGGTEQTPRLSRAAVGLLILLPLIFIPIGRLTPPFIGLWPAMAVGVIGIKLLLAAPTFWERRIALSGLSLAALTLVIWGFALGAQGIPGSVPKFDFTLKPGASSWPVKTMGFLILILSVMVHESAHGLAAFFSGDLTAKRAGRISLNPLRHIDPFGTIILPGLLMLLPGGVVFGWAKPVPVDYSKFRQQRQGQLAVSLAGVGSNLFLAFACSSLLMVLGVWLHLSYPAMSSSGFANPWQEVVLNGVPQVMFWKLLIEFLKAGVLINMVLFSLNILPIPPLDGYNAVAALLPGSLQAGLAKIRGVGMVLLLALIVLKVIDYLLLPGIISAIILTGLAGGVAKLG